MQHEHPERIGPHDLGGLEAGVLERAGHDLAWWERQVDAMIILLIERGLMQDVAQLRDGIERLSEAQLAAPVTRDTMIGVTGVSLG